MPNAFVLMDLDNVWGGALAMSNDRDVVAELEHALGRAAAETGWALDRGHAVMNRATARALPRQALDLLSGRGFETSTVENVKESADKELFYELSKVAAGGVRRFLFVSGDTDFAQLAGHLHADYAADGMELAVVGSRFRPRLIDAYRPSGARMIDLRRAQRSGVAVPRSSGGSDPRASAGTARSTGSGPAPGHEHGPPHLDGMGGVLTCPNCGTRRLLQRMLANAVCPHCGVRMRTGGEFAPRGAVPFVDGPLVQVRSMQALRRQIVLARQTTILGRDPTGAVGGGEVIDVSEAIHDPTLQGKVSTRQIAFVVEGKDRITLDVLPNTRKVFDADGHPLEPGTPIGLRHGDRIYINDPNEPRHRDYVLELTILTNAASTGGAT